MKKTVISILIVVLGIMLIGCNGNSKTESSAEDLQKTSSIVSNNNHNLITSEDEEFIYFVDMMSMSVKKVAKADGSVENIYTFEDINNFVNIFEYFDGRLYFITYQGELISMDTNGENLLKSTFSLEGSEELLEYTSPVPTPYVFGENLYFAASDSVYLVDPDTLTLTPADDEIKNQYITSDKTIFTKKAENGLGRLYATPENGEMTLFSAEDESVLLTHVNFTDAYVFYMAFKDNNFDSLNLYRVDLDGENKVLVKEFDLYKNNADIKYDNAYIYLLISDDEYLKINKETLEETNIVSAIKDNNLTSYEVSNGKFFQTVQPYYVDSTTGEKVEL